jgi:hypothetical protein
MWNLGYVIIKDFGALGVGVVQLGIIGFFGYKLFTNHLKHIQLGINENTKETKEIKVEIVHLKERVSTIEGKLS